MKGHDISYPKLLTARPWFFVKGTIKAMILVCRKFAGEFYGAFNDSAPLFERKALSKPLGLSNEFLNEFCSFIIVVTTGM